MLDYITCTEIIIISSRNNIKNLLNVIIIQGDVNCKWCFFFSLNLTCSVADLYLYLEVVSLGNSLGNIYIPVLSYGEMLIENNMYYSRIVW